MSSISQNSPVLEVSQTIERVPSVQDEPVLEVSRTSGTTVLQVNSEPILQDTLVKDASVQEIQPVQSEPILEVSQVQSFFVPGGISESKGASEHNSIFEGALLHGMQLIPSIRRS